MLAPGRSLPSHPPGLPPSNPPTPAPPIPPAATFPQLSSSCLLTAHQSSHALKLTFGREQPASENHFFLKNLTKEFY